MATFKIGLNSTSLTTLTPPNGESGLDTSYLYKMIIKESTQNDRNVTFVGRQKKDIVLDFVHKKQSEFNSIFQYCNQTLEYFVEIKTDANLIYFNNFAFLTLESVQIDTVADDFRHNFKIRIMEF